MLLSFFPFRVSRSVAISLCAATMNLLPGLGLALSLSLTHSSTISLLFVLIINLFLIIIQ